MNTAEIIADLQPLVGHRIHFLEMQHEQNCTNISHGIPASRGDDSKAIYFPIIFESGEKDQVAIIKFPWLIEHILWCDENTVHIYYGQQCETIKKEKTGANGKSDE